MGLIPVELDIEGLYETQDRRRKKSTSDKVVPPHVHSRRRAQNRASQRAFRDRKEKRMKEIEEKLDELQGQHSDLTRSYEALQVEYASVKQELDQLRRKNESHSPEDSSYAASSIREWEECQTEPTDPLLFDVSAFCYEPEDEAEQKGERG
ncbi:hypothetical protein OIDMADRAFT_112975 [Oidiodendron maius Zn]|uniref:Putative transcription factor kapC n=1 Tax=Oidiodendron maius (strain Zn) TaxID=913774 RepID=A0A0C3HB88_OIDMZ|nr:hypothetical protein OIDMADRAFT_112975 [Oidiodendron maius Zn]